MQRTAGGHRKIPIASVIQFLRQTKRELVRPEIIGLPPRTDTVADSMDQAIEDTLGALAGGDPTQLHGLVFPFYLRGHSLAEICDRLLSPAMHRIGTLWQSGSLEIFEEHRAVEMMVRLLHDFRLALPESYDGPKAIGGTVDGDRYQLPTQMIELSLAEIGWNSTSLGVSLPFHTLLSAAEKNRPKIIWLSVSELADEKPFVRELREFCAAVPVETIVFFGGRATSGAMEVNTKAVRCHTIQDLVTRAQGLTTSDAEPGARTKSTADDVDDASA